MFDDPVAVLILLGVIAFVGAELIALVVRLVRE